MRVPRPANYDKAGCRAACPQAAGEVCGNEKPCGLPLWGGGVPDAPRKCAAAEGSGGVKTPPYDAKDKRAVMARLRAGHARPLRNMVMWDVGRPAPRPPGRLAAM